MNSYTCTWLTSYWLNGCAAECMKSNGTSVIECLVGLLNMRSVASMVPIDWTSACVVSYIAVKAISISVLVLGI